MSEDISNVMETATTFLARINAEAAAAKAVAPNYAEIALARAAVRDAIISGELAELTEVQNSFPWIATPTPRVPQFTRVTSQFYPPDSPVETIHAAIVAADDRIVVKDSGKRAVGENGETVAITSIVDPSADREAARLTKETGFMHIVNPKTGKVESTQFAVAPQLPGGGELVVDPNAPIIPDERPVVGGSNKYDLATLDAQRGGR